MRARLALSLAFTVFVTATTSFDARADGDPEGAKRHFEAGKKLRAEDDCTRAIPEFEKSLAADRSIGAYYNLGYCQEQLGRRPEAYDAYRRARDLASLKKDDRLKEISGALAALLETPNIRLVLPQPLPNGFQLTVDGEVVPQEQFQAGAETVVFTKSTPTHDVKASAAGFDDTIVKVDTKALRAIEMKAASAKTAPPPPAARREAPGQPFYRTPFFGIALGVLGLGAATVGTVVLVSAQTDTDNAKQEADNALRRCGPGGTPIDQQGCRDGANVDTNGRAAWVSASDRYNRELKDTQQVFATLAIPMWVAGAALIGTGIYIVATAKSEPDATTAKAKSPTLPSFVPIVGKNVGGLAMTLPF